MHKHCHDCSTKLYADNQAIHSGYEVCSVCFDVRESVKKSIQSSFSSIPTETCNICACTLTIGDARTAYLGKMYCKRCWKLKSKLGIPTMKILSPEEREAFKRDWDKEMNKNIKEAKKAAQSMTNTTLTGVGTLIKGPSKFNEPVHYHKHGIDTIKFLQEGFPPSVFKGFAIGSAVKYIHRYEHKNGMEDLLKAKDYIERLIAFHEESPSK